MRRLYFLLLSASLLLSSFSYAEDNVEGDELKNQYIDLKPSFITNYGGAGRLRYLKADIALRVENPKGLRHHMPFIRHELVMLLSRQSEEDLSTMEGKEILRQNALNVVQKVLLEEDGEQYVTDLLFKAFIVQR